MPVEMESCFVEDLYCVNSQNEKVKAIAGYLADNNNSDEAVFGLLIWVISCAYSRKRTTNECE